MSGHKDWWQGRKKGGGERAIQPTTVGTGCNLKDPDMKPPLRQNGDPCQGTSGNPRRPQTEFDLNLALAGGLQIKDLATFEQAA